MANEELGRNKTFPIYNPDGTPFHDLVLHKATYDSVVMSLGDKITGDVYYKDNALDVSMQEYIEYQPNDDSDVVKYMLVNPPTIVREGLVKDNGDLRGMTKYSFEFYHPMYMLGNFPFSDVAVINTDERYRSESKKFSWIGNLYDYIAKLNKNLENTEWVVLLSDKVAEGVASSLSSVLAFDGNTIADALKTGHDTWNVPFVIDSIKQGEPYYNAGKRFCILFGLPSNEIYASEYDRVHDEHFVFKFGRGLGLKNNSATPRNNKIITRISGYGSEDNIPYGYPQIVWYGNQDWEYTINNDPNNYYSYPIYSGIVGGRWVKLIKHPFTRTTLMPTIYAETLFNKVSPYLEGDVTAPNYEPTPNPNYNPNLELVDYYDADDPLVYPNVISPLSPSYDIKQFEDIKPELGEQHIEDAWPINNDGTPASHWVDDVDVNSGDYVQSYFKVRLPILSFDLYASAAITQQMEINMRSGACIGCTFPVQVDWDDYRANMYDANGNFAPDGAQRDTTKYPKSNEREIELILQKEYSTFGTIMPNTFQYPKQNDIFVILGISLPLSYITNAQTRLDEAMKSYMLENNVYYFDYPLKFDEKFLAENTNILSQIRNNTVIHFEFAGVEMELYVKQITIKYGVSPLPQYDITLTDDVEVVLNQIGQAQEDIGKINSLIAAIQQNYGRNVWAELAKKLSKTNDDVAYGKIWFDKGFQSEKDGTFGNWLQDVTGAAIYQDEQGGWHVEADYLQARRKLIAKELQIEEITHVGGQQLLTAAAMNCDIVVEHDTFYRCYFLKNDGEKTIYNSFKKGDQARMQSFNVSDWGEHSVENRFYWRLVIGTSNNSILEIAEYDEGFGIQDEKYLPDNISSKDYHFIDLSKEDCAARSDAPIQGDKIVQLGYRYTDEPSRQNAIMIAGAGEASPYIDEYVGINSYTLDGTVQTRIKPNQNFFTGTFKLGTDTTIDGSNLFDILNRYSTDITEIGQDVNSIRGDIAEIENYTTGNENLLRNTGFTGDYETTEFSEEIGVRDDTKVYSDPLKYWNNTNASVVVEINSASGFAVVLNNGNISQDSTKALVAGDWYNVSFRASGTFLQLSIGGYSESVILTNDIKTYSFKFRVSNDTIRSFSIFNADARVMEIQLSCGSIRNADWIPSPLDNPKVIAYYQDLVYLANAMTQGSTTAIGGLILTQMIRVGNYMEGAMTQETGGMSGVYTSGNSPFLWGGGTMEQAFYAIAKYAADPSYQATAEEVAQMAKFVVTHGGRAILNDIILRGYIYALGGMFKGSLEIGRNDKFIVDAEKGELRMNGASMAQDLPSYPTDETSQRIDLLKLFYQVDPDTLARVAQLYLNSAIGHVSIDAAYGLRHTDDAPNYPSSITADYTNGFQHKTPTFETYLSNGELVIVNKIDNKEFRFDGRSARWYINGSQTMGGVLTVDENGFLKVLSE